MTEGVETEVQYLQGLAQFMRDSGMTVRGVRPAGVGKDPLRVLKRAAEIVRADPDGYDDVWVVVDVDDHTTLDDCMRDAPSSGVRVVVSNPCFEIWLLWHYEGARHHQSKRDLDRRLAAHGHEDKNLPVRFPFSKFADASTRSEASLAAHTTLGPNPSSSMHLLVRTIPR